jgi:hypothetical protein
MSYEAAILSAGGDDSVLVKSFIIAADKAAVKWYSLMSPGVIHGWEDLKQRILSNFQGFQNPKLTESDLFSCMQKAKNLFTITSEDSSILEPRHQSVGRHRYQCCNRGFAGRSISFASQAREAQNNPTFAQGI